LRSYLEVAAADRSGVPAALALAAQPQWLAGVFEAGNPSGRSDVSVRALNPKNRRYQGFFVSGDRWFPRLGISGI
jgi:hypothetical protein